MLLMTTLIGASVLAQGNEDAEKTTIPVNVVKINLGSIAVKNIALQFETPLVKRFR